MAEALGKDFIDTKIDTQLMKGGKEVAARLRKGKRGGIPWMVILDGDGKQLVTSDGPNGNVGCPVTKEEVAWFMTMLRKTAKHMNEDDLTTVHKALETYAEKFRNPQRGN